MPLAVFVLGEIWVKLLFCGVKSFHWKGDEWQPWPCVPLIPAEQCGLLRAAKVPQSKTEHLETCSLLYKRKIIFGSQSFKNSFNLLLPFLALQSYDTGCCGPGLCHSGKGRLLPESSLYTGKCWPLRREMSWTDVKQKPSSYNQPTCPVPASKAHFSKLVLSMETYGPSPVFCQVSFLTKLLPE